ncbi:CHAT domain-containing protein [Tamlana crocina]|uniref:CHAT domain-containing protein n=1 Tax=Tamlana crocina TaxID=393006 RepID=A0ABX1DCG3_9FLAO|nr:CHAT domain-containing protein [Tamlana crocina]NJX16045.1 CHAT domain-containing protein [Tamlana crocina]
MYAEIVPNTKTALYYFDLSFYVSELLRISWTAQETKILNQSATRIRSEKCIDLLFNTFQKTKNDSIAFTALQYAENSKASSLMDMFLKKQRLKTFPNDTLLQNEFRLLKKQEHITSLLVKEQLGNNRVSKINEYNKTLSQISLDLKTLKQAISKAYPSEQNQFSLLELQQQLQKDQAVLIEYFYGKHHIYQFVVSAQGIDFFRIANTPKIEKNLVDFTNLFNDPNTINNDITHFTNQAFGIFKLLNLQKVINHKNVLLITDGLLNFIPFDALLTQESTTTVFEKMPFVVRSNHLAYAASALMYLNTKDFSADQSVLGVFPVFEDSSQSLTFSKAEAEVLKDEMHVTLLMHAEASKHDFIKKGGNYGILHLSTHAQSGDFVNPASISFYDEDLALNELYALDLNSNLVVLSACETGIGKLYKSEGAMSVARGFQYAGAQNVLFSLWQINDLATSQIMQSFYTNFGEHQSAFVANSQSKKEYLDNESISNIKKSPYYWSAFVYYGSLDIEKKQNLDFYVIFGILLLFITLFLVFKRKRYGSNTSTIPSR